jgi:hypothetical protein
MPAFFRHTSALPAALLLLLAAGPALAQSSSSSSSSSSSDAPAAGSSGDCQTNLSQPVFAENRSGKAATADEENDAPSADAKREAALTPAEERVRKTLSEPGVHVVRLWAPWCSNSTAEMADGAWDGLAAENDDVSVTFVTVWNNGNGGAGAIEKYGLPLEQRITEVVPAAPEQGRLDAFMGYSLHWVPSTWIFRTDEDGQTERAFAMNYGEMNRSTLQTLIDAAQREW